MGDCVPFYSCPRSVVLFVIQRANHQELTYQGGQGPIVRKRNNSRIPYWLVSCPKIETGLGFPC